MVGELLHKWLPRRCKRNAQPVAQSIYKNLMLVKRWALDFQGFSKVEGVKKTSLSCRMKGIQTTFILQERLKMDYTTLIPESKEGQERPPKQMQSLYEVCQQVVDGRCARGKRYEIADLLVLLVLAKLAGMQSLLA